MSRMQTDRTKHLIQCCFSRLVWAATLSAWLFAKMGSAQCVNAIVCENQLQGAANWDPGTGDSTIQGFATDISVNAGQTVFFKINTNASNYHLDIYRLGYYGGAGARLITTITPSASLPQTQPACLTDSPTNLADCGNWAVSASWQVPSSAVSGIYFANLVRADTGGTSQVFWVVRNDGSHSDILFSTSDQTWEAYNPYGGHSLYGGPATFDLNNRAFKVSYNRPFNTRGFEAATFLYNAEYPMVRWLEANGYDVSYFTNVDAVRNSSFITNHKVFLSVGHDEYVSGERRTNTEAARNAGVNLAFFSGNEVFWKTRWENSIDGTNTPYRTMVCYKETYYASGTLYQKDPLDPTTWTGTWRDPRFSPPADGGRPENALTGTIFEVNGPGSDNTNLSIMVPAADGKMRFWRNTSIASQGLGQSATLPAGTLGYEWDADLDNGFRPGGLVPLSTSTYTMTQDKLLDYGAAYGAGDVTHHLTLYRASSGALVFGAGTVQWAWGLDSNHDGGSNAADLRMQQATLNLFADMGIQPATMQSGLVAASKSTDTTPPTSAVTSPAPGSTIQYGVPITLTGTATDSGGGVIGAVEVSIDGGQSWHPATGREQWSFPWTPSSVTGSATVLVRAVDDSVNLQPTPTSVTFTVSGNAACPCSIWSPSAVPGTVSSNDASAIEVGLKFRSDVAGNVTGVRFYKASNNTGTHIGNLWTLQGTNLATVTFTNETASGWQQATFSSPIPISANTTYIVSYYAPNGEYSDDEPVFANSGVNNPPLHALQNGVDGGNGVYIYATGGGFPINTFNSANYWVDLVFVPAGTLSISGTITGASGVTVTLSGASTATVTTDSSGNYSFGNLANGSYTVTPSKLGFTFNPTNAPVTISGSNVTGVNFTATAVPTFTISGTISPTSAGSGATVTLSGSASATVSADSSGNYSFTVVNGAYTVTPSKVGFAFSPGSQNITVNGANITGVNFTGTPTLSIWSSSAVPGNPSQPDTSVELGLKFRSDVAGSVTGVRFYKGSGNTGTHIGDLWTSTGTKLATVTFANETASGWQQANFPSPVAISANTTYVVSYYAPNGGYAADLNFFATSGVDNPPLHALANGVDGPNGVYLYATGGGFPTNTFNSTNYWVDIVFTSTPTWSISGTITGGAGATVTLSGAGSGTQTADSSGNYTFSGLANGSYTVTPSKTGFTMSPANAAVTVNGANVTGVNFTATAIPTWSISGAITGGAGATVTLSGGGTGTVTADSSGNYSFTGLANGSYTVTPSKTGFTFTPANAAVTVNGANVTGVNFTATAIPTWSISGTITGGAGATVTLSGSGTGTVTADSSGNYSFTGLGNGSYTVTPSKAGSTFSPLNAAVTVNGANVTGVNFTAIVGISIDVKVFKDQATVSSTVVSPSFSTTSGNELLLAFITADYLSGANTTVSGVTGAGLTWVLVRRTNTQSGTSEIWRSFASAALTNVTVTATLSQSVISSMTVMSFAGVNTSGTNGSGAVGATGTGNATSGAPTASLVTTANNSWVFGVGNDFDNAIARTPGSTQTLVHQYLTPGGDTYWVQMQNNPTPTTGTTVVINDTAPTTDRYNLTICEILQAPPGGVWSISGNAGTSGATVTLSGAANATATADSSGNYTFTGLANGGYTVTPSKAGFTFTPPNTSVTVNGANATGINFTATPVPTFSISGTISPTAGGAGATVTLSGAGSATQTADSSGNYTFTGLVNGNYTVTPSKSGFTFSPVNAAVTVSGANVTGVNFTATAGISIDAKVFKDQATASVTVASPAFSTTSGNELLLAFIGTDYLSGANTTVSGVAGAGLTWVLVRRTNTRSGSSEIWRAFAGTALTNVTVTATLSQSVISSMTVMSFAGVNTSGTNGSGAIGATGTGNAASGAPTASLVTTVNNSWVFGVGNDFDNAIARTPGSGQSLVHQFLSSAGDTYWVQMQNNPTPTAGTAVTINDTAPTTDRYNLTICEIHP